MKHVRFLTDLVNERVRPEFMDNDWILSVPVEAIGTIGAGTREVDGKTLAVIFVQYDQGRSTTTVPVFTHPKADADIQAWDRAINELLEQLDDPVASVQIDGTNVICNALEDFAAEHSDRAVTSS